MFSLDFHHGSLIPLTLALIAYVTSHALNIAHTLNGLSLDLDCTEVVSEGLAHSLKIEVSSLIAHAGAFGAAVVRLVTVVG